MRHVLIWCAAGWMTICAGRVLSAQGTPTSKTLEPTPKSVSMAQLKDVGNFEGQLVQIDAATVRHADTAQVFTLREPQGMETNILIPSPATDGARVGDAVSITGHVRKFEPNQFEKDYKWFRRADYPDVHVGDCVVVATSVRTQEGT